MQIEPIVIVGVIVALGEILKGFKVPSKFIPVFNMAIGVGASLALNNGSLIFDIFEGVVLGLTASGLYDLAGKPIRNAIVKPTE